MNRVPVGAGRSLRSVVDEEYEEEKKSIADEDGKGIHIGLANSIKVSSSELR